MAWRPFDKLLKGKKYVVGRDRFAVLHMALVIILLLAERRERVLIDCEAIQRERSMG